MRGHRGPRFPFRDLFACFTSEVGYHQARCEAPRLVLRLLSQRTRYRALQGPKAEGLLRSLTRFVTGNRFALRGLRALCESPLGPSALRASVLLRLLRNHSPRPIRAVHFSEDP